MVKNDIDGIHKPTVKDFVQYTIQILQCCPLERRNGTETKRGDACLRLLSHIGKLIQDLLLDDLGKQDAICCVSLDNVDAGRKG